ncbi:phospholipase A2 inhibitor and Ly6/PLAUR domain-containing protein-like [Hyperolius riggenbachi]|uniref:phospholipase A2 inhibitor and Ly6/PLAUR domain-containing protein-like n=1 Tax=Hyperolius riggenbachi TaxID=752182 RepID=UPI0035A38511
MACTGEEKYCLKYQKMVMMGTLLSSISSGCASENICKENRNLTLLTPPRSLETSECFTVSSNTDLKPGHFIWCHICHDVPEHCRGQSFLCPPSEDVCLFERMRIIYDGRDEFENTRRCGKSSECSRTGTIRSSTKVIMINTTCCDRNECQPPLPALPIISDEENGLICPACFVPNSDRCLGRNNLKCTVL